MSLIALPLIMLRILWRKKTGPNPPPGFLDWKLVFSSFDCGFSRKNYNGGFGEQIPPQPRRIFNLPRQSNTYIEVDLDTVWTIPNTNTFSKAKWTPFAGFKVIGKLQRVVIRGEIAYVDGKVHVNPGFGENVRDSQPMSPASLMVSSPNFHATAAVTHGEELTINVEDTHSPEIGYLSAGEENGGVLSVLTSPNVPKRKVATDHLAPPNLLMTSVTTVCGSLKGKHLLTTRHLSKDECNQIFEVAHNFKMNFSKARYADYVLKGKLLAMMFYEPSTRTSSSFAAAMMRLGGRILNLDIATSSVKKGESLEDSVIMMSSYADLVVIRHPEPGAVSVSLEILKFRID
ncbi:UNVERIFIED_CONTAM: hypothetical protein GTU68_064670 [Idotea baltica]|nr:hypothetical protein [Idotea baltica]